MPVTRIYACDECAYEWRFFHMRSDEPYPDCPQCAADRARSLPTMFAITGTKAKAVDMAQRIAEEDYGLTDMNDNLREGDIAAKAPPPVQAAEAEALTRAMKDMAPEITDAQAEAVKNFWQPGSSVAPQAMQQTVAAPGAAAARALGADPVEMVHKSAKKAEGAAGPKYRVEGRAKMSDL